MIHEDKDVQDFVSDYERDFGVQMRVENADRICGSIVATGLS
jgi:hypothetical protein